jgi:hypothetical protein
VVEAARKVSFRLSKAEKALIPIVARYQQNADAEVFAAYYVNLELAIACTTTGLESNGLNVYGADPASAWINDGPYGTLWEHEVTESNFRWFWSRVEAGAVSDGVGPKQLTSASLIAAANARGGAWIPERNCGEGNRFFQELLNQTGSIWESYFHYNGGGSVAANYANRAVGIVAEWRARLA